MTSTRPAVLFDIDGTLLDTNYFHSVSWWYALREAGEDIAMARIHPLIGMGSDQLLTDLLGEEREGLSDLHAKYYKPYKKDLHAFPKAADLLGAVAERGVQVVLATSSKEEDLDQLLEALGAEDGVIDEIVHGDMVGSSKPAPGHLRRGPRTARARPGADDGGRRHPLGHRGRGQVRARRGHRPHRRLDPPGPHRRRRGGRLRGRRRAPRPTSTTAPWPVS